MKARASRGFTLVEVLVTMGLIAALILLIVPSFQRMQEEGRSTTCTNNLRELGIALTGYLAEHDNIMPECVSVRLDKKDDEPAIDTVLAPYVGSKAIFICPSDTAKHLGEISGTSYWWNNGLNNQPRSEMKFLRLAEEASRVPMMGDKEGFHLYRDVKLNILYGDGHVAKEMTFRSGS